MTAPIDPKVGRQDVLTLFLKAALFVVLGMAVATLLAGERHPALGQILVVMLVAVPLVRVAWLAVRWFGKGDYRFGLVALALLAMVGLAAAVLQV
jgi:hypothetical protein